MEWVERITFIEVEWDTYRTISQAEDTQVVAFQAATTVKKIYECQNVVRTHIKIEIKQIVKQKFTNRIHKQTQAKFNQIITLSPVVSKETTFYHRVTTFI